MPKEPRFTTVTERKVWTRLRDTLGPHDLLLSNLRLTDRTKDHELDVVVGIPGVGLVVVEVKGSSVWHDGEGWLQEWGKQSKAIHPVDQARAGLAVLRPAGRAPRAAAGADHRRPCGQTGQRRLFRPQRRADDRIRARRRRHAAPPGACIRR